MFKTLFGIDLPKDESKRIRILIKVINGKPSFAALNFDRIVVFFSHVESKNTEQHAILSTTYPEKDYKVSLFAVGHSDIHLSTKKIYEDEDESVDYDWLTFDTLLNKFAKNTLQVGVSYLVDKVPANLEELSQLTAKIDKDPKIFPRLTDLVRFTPELQKF